MCSFEMTIPRDKNSQHSVNDNVSGYFVIISHNQIENLIHLRMQHGSSEVLRAVYAMKWPSKMLQNLPFLWKSQCSFFKFIHLVNKKCVFVNGSFFNWFKTRLIYVLILKVEFNNIFSIQSSFQYSKLLFFS